MIDMFGLLVACLVLSWVSVFVRLWVKIFLTKRVGLNDWILLLAVILFSGQCGCLLIMMQTGPKYPTHTPQFQSYMFLGAFNLTLMTAICVKTSLAISLNRFFAHRWQRLVIITVTVVFCIFSIVEIFLGLFFCGLPTTMARKQNLAQCAHWEEMTIWYLIAAIFNAVTDWFYVLLPAIVVWLSNLTLTVKLSISIITLVGSFSGVAAVFRVLGAHAFTTLQDFDPAGIAVIACAVLEMAFGIIATAMTNATQLPGHITRSRTESLGAANLESTFPEDDTNVIKLSPIICQQKFDDGTAASTMEHHDDAFPPDPEALALPTPSRKANRFSWSRAFGAPGSSVSMPNNITLLIDDISDDEDEDESNTDKESKDVKKTYSNV